MQSLDSLYIPHRLLVHGDGKTGKSLFALSAFNHLEKIGRKPEEARMVWIDFDDGGVGPLINRGAIKPAWKSRFALHYAVKNYAELMTATDETLALIEEEKKTLDPRNMFIVIDNMKRPYQYFRDEHARKIYGMANERERAEARRVEALSKGNKTLPTFSKDFDWPIISGNHEAWLSRILSAGVNVILLSPSSIYEEEEDGKKTKSLVIKGQSENILKVSDVVHLTVNETVNGGFLKTEHFMTVRGRSFDKVLPPPLVNPSFETYVKAIEYVKAEAQKMGMA